MKTMTRTSRNIINFIPTGSKSQKTKGNVMPSFLPEDYEAPTTAGNYMKLLPGENKIRILSAPILGWEDWTLEKKPIRFRYKEKPSKSIDPARPVKHFWAMIVWNYKEERIQILQITQASIRNALQALYENEDWGAPYFYDIKITKKGEKVETEYNVAPSPHKPVTEEIKSAFHSKPINLEALFDGADPFADVEHYTAGIFEDKDAPLLQKEPTLSIEQQTAVIDLIGEDEALATRILSGYKVESLEEIPAKHFTAIISRLSQRK